MNKRGFLIFNPSAGSRNKSKSLVAGVVRRFADRGIEMTPSPTEPNGNVLQQVRELLTHTPDMLVAWGGDGTINEVVNGMFRSKVPVGIMPGGTANVLARELKIPHSSTAAVDVIAGGATRAISVGKANHRYFLLMVGIGFDSEVIKNTDWSLKKRLGTIAFGISALSTARTYEFPKFKVKVDEQETDAIFAVICNARQYAAYFILTPAADISDEYFYVCLFKEPGIMNMSRYFFHVLQGKHGSLQSVEVLKGSRVEVLGAENIAVQADGELIGFLPLKFEIHPRALNVFVPNNTVLPLG